jgi:hypothetical protein
MIVPPRIDQFELGSEGGGNGFRIVAHDRQPAAPFRTIRSERRDDHVTSCADRFLQADDVCIAVGGLCEKMEGGAIVPQVIRARRLPARHICSDPVNSVRAPPEPLFRLLEGVCGKVEYRYSAESLFKEAINKS